ncbi:sporulation protein [Amycolatopsis sp. cg5]|uniref:sporulation protein n=1 Tax=Amycolatopsis sp. cg5 TaxID=3238802 RepID=UPI0035261E66
MVFKKMLQKFGVGGPSVDTVLSESRCHPGGLLSGEVRLTGGEADADIEHIALSLVVRGGRAGSLTEFHRVVVSGATRLEAKQQRTIPFTMPVPWETPVTEVTGQALPGIEVGLRTELAIAKAVDKGDLDPVIVAPAPAHDAVLDAFGQLGFGFKSVELEAGRVHGLRQELPFYQEIAFYPSGPYAGRLSEVELVVVAERDGVQVVLEADRRGGDVQARFAVGHEEALDTEWARLIGDWLDRVAAQHGHHGYGHHDEYGHHDGYGQRRGPGMGAVVAGAAAGVVGGMVLGEVLDDAFEDDE